MPTGIFTKVSEFTRLKKKLRSLRKPIDSRTAKKVGKEVRDEIRAMTSKGQSTVREFGKRMPKYKNPDRYPGNQKRKRPVNLRLTGRFMKALSFSVKSSRLGFETFIGYRGGESKKEQGHRVGVGGQPKRPTIPKAPKEQFAARIQRVIDKIYRKRLQFVIKSRNPK